MPQGLKVREHYLTFQNFEIQIPGVIYMPPGFSLKTNHCKVEENKVTAIEHMSQ